MIATFKKILWLLNPSERRRFYILVAAITFGALVEASSIASVLPLLSLLSDPDLIASNDTLAWAYRISGVKSVRQFQILVAIIVFCVVVIGLVLKIITLYAISRFGNMRGFTLSSRLLQGYLHQPYYWFLGRHTSDLGKSILSEVNMMVQATILPAMRFVSSLTLSVFLIGLLLLAEPIVALVSALVLGASYGAIYFSVRNLMLRLGQRRKEANKQRFFLAQEATGGIKDVKLMGLEEAYVRRFNLPARQMASNQATIQVLKDVPRYLLQMLSFGGILILILVLLFTSTGNLEDVIPTLGLIAFAGMRLLPALQGLFASAAAVRSGQAVFDEILLDFREILGERVNWNLKASGERLSLQRSLVLDDVHFSYPEAEGAALSGLSMSIKARTTVGLVGGTGAGKTTAVDLILGLLQPTHGQILVDGKPVTRDNRRAWQRAVGYVPQHIFLTADTIVANIAFGVPEDEIDMKAVERASRIAALHDFVMTTLPQGYATQVGERGVRLSGGQRQRIGIARALYHDPDVLVMDEATSALDTLTERVVMEAVHNIGDQKTIILIAHRLSTVRNCDEIFLLERGRVSASGRFEELIDRSRTFAAMAQHA